MEIDNFEIIRKHLTFEDKFDRYVIHILRRTKDVKVNGLGSNESQRMLRTYYVNDIEYFNRKEPAIKELCETNKARAYILPQVRNNKECLIELGKLVLENLENPTIKLDGIVRTAVCSNHRSRDKKWIVDFDYSESYGWEFDKVLDIVKKQLVKDGKTENDCYVVPTKNGKHIVTAPFNLLSVQKKCDMMFEGTQRRKTGERQTGPGECEDVFKNVNGWLHKDGMTLLYFKNND